MLRPWLGVFARLVCGLLPAFSGGRALAAELTLAVQPRWRQASLAVPSADLRNDAGQVLRLTRFSALLSGVALGRADGSVVRLEGQFGFLDAEAKRLAATFRNVPAGDYTQLEFQLGLPPEINHADSARWPAGHALHPLVNRLHWSWQGGYVFAALEGRWSAAADPRDASPSAAAARAAGPDASGARGFLYHLATDAHRMTVRFRADFRIEGDTAIDLALDFARVLAPRRLAAEDGSETTHSAAGDLLAPELAIALERAWFWLDCRAAAVAVRPQEKETPPTATAPLATPYAFVVPEGFPAPALPADNPLTVEGIALGRALFAERRLSGNGTQSCASCHAPQRAFSDAVPVSRGAEGTRGTRNAMPLFNLAWHPSYAWDGSRPRIRDQALAAWTNPVEMHGDPAGALARLAADAPLAEKFRAAFGSAEMTPERVTRALEQYLLTIVSADSKFDRARRGEATLTAAEKRGFELFMTESDPARGKFGADCFHCHGGPLFSDFAFKDTGVVREPVDPGRALVTDAESDRGKFKTPSLRNVALTAPYGHDGRFATLERVIGHYDRGVRRSANLDPNLAKHGPRGLELTRADQEALIAFLQALTDPAFAAQ
jgi:cytochrome c peroxidase